MLERMFFDVTRGGVHSQVDIWVEDGKVYHKARLFNAVPDLSLESSDAYDRSTEWLMRLSRLDLRHLASRYRSENPEDVVWTLHYKESGQEEIRSTGLGEYPPGWDELLLLVDELAPEAEFIDPFLIEMLYLTYETEEQSDFGLQEYHEEMTLDRRTQTLRYRRSFSDEVYVQTEYKNRNEVSICLDMWDRYFSDAPQVSVDDNETANVGRLSIILDRHNGDQEHYIWDYSRTCLPEEWPQFIGMIGHRLQISTMFVNLINPGYYLHGARRGEVIYCTVKVPSLHRSFYYKTEDNAYHRGDKVLVPTGSHHEPTSGEITKIEYFYPENVPFPLDEVESILGPDFDVEENIKK